MVGRRPRIGRLLMMVLALVFHVSLHGRLKPLQCIDARALTSPSVIDGANSDSEKTESSSSHSYWAASCTPFSIRSVCFCYVVNDELKSVQYMLQKHWYLDRFPLLLNLSFCVGGVERMMC